MNTRSSDVRNTIGVVRVRNDLAVRPPGYPTDADVVRAARAAFARDPYLSDDRFDVDVRDGVLTLRGPVGSRFERQYAEVKAGRVILSGRVADYHEFAQASKSAREAGANEVENLLEVGK